jgi:hypothetical protein
MTTKRDIRAMLFALSLMTIAAMAKGERKMRDRLVELLNKAQNDWLRKEYDGETSKELAEYVADYLLSEGVIVPPCKVGDTVYRVARHKGVWQVLPREVVSITHRLDHLYRLVWEIFSTEYDRLGKTVFLTKEEAEKALAERSGE